MALSGDRAILDSDGLIQLMGRDSLCINSGGEKIFTEEVECVLLDHPAVTDVLVVGVSDEEWGQSPVAIISIAAGATVTTADMLSHAKGDWPATNCQNDLSSPTPCREFPAASRAIRLPVISPRPLPAPA